MVLDSDCTSLTVWTNISKIFHYKDQFLTLDKRHVQLHAAHCIIPTTLGLFSRSIGLELNWD